MRRYELNDEQWERIAGLFPEEGAVQGRPWRSHRQVFNGILWVLCSGAAWRDLPERFGPWKTVYGRFRRWRDDGTFARLLGALQLQLNEEGLLDWDKWYVDSTTARAHRSAAGASQKKSPRGT